MTPAPHVEHSMTLVAFKAALAEHGYPIDDSEIASTSLGQPGTVGEFDFASHMATPKGDASPVRYLNPRMYRDPDQGWSAKVDGDWTPGTKRLATLLSGLVVG